MMPAKIATIAFPKIKIFWNKGYDDIISSITSCESNYIADVVMWPKFGNSSIPMRKVIIWVKGLTRRTTFFEG